MTDCPTNIIPPKILTILPVTVMRRTSGLVLRTSKESDGLPKDLSEGTTRFLVWPNYSDPFRRSLAVLRPLCAAAVAVSPKLQQRGNANGRS